MPVVENYWSGVLRRLQAEVEVFNELIRHPGEKGRANELSLAHVISRLVPLRYSVGSGLLIDSNDRSSRQTDIVIFNRSDEPALLAQSTQILFPVENVSLCIEVKTAVGKDEIADANEKRLTVDRLVPRSGAHPKYVLFGFEAAELSVDSLATHLQSANSQLDLVCILKEGLVAGWSRLLCSPTSRTDSDSYVVGITTLRTEQGEELIAAEKAASGGLPPSFVRHQDRLYPVVRRRNRERLISDPARALLLFCDGLLRLLAERDESITPTMAHYISDSAREMLAL